VTVSVLYDVSPITAANTGVARYAAQLLAALPGAGVDVHPFALGRGRYPAPPGTVQLGVPRRLVEIPWASFGWPTAEQIARQTADVVHITDRAPMPSRRPIVATVHDLAALDRPSLHARRSVRQQRAQLAALGKAALIIAVSRETADALVRHGVAANRIEVVRSGFTELPPPQRIPGLAPGFVLAVGTVHARKGLDVLLRALPDTPGMDVVIAGPDAGGTTGLRALASALGVEARVRFLGEVTDANLSWLYGNAGVFVFPSLAEGFGLPVLEAMVAGVPTLCTDLPVLHEVAGDAAVYFPAGDSRRLAALLTGLDPSASRQLAAAGRARAAGFTWAATAAATAACYVRAAAG